MAGAVRQIGIKLVIDGQSAQAELPKIGREFDRVASSAEQAAARTSRGLQQMDLSIGSIVKGAAGLQVVAGGFNAITEAIKALPKAAFGYSSEMETTRLGMAGILGSMTAINGKQTDFNQALQIGNQYIRKLNDDALRTAATSQELVGVFQALMAPGLGARMTLDEIRQLTVVGTNAVKSMGLAGAQVVQELRDLVQGGITASGSTLATALGLKDADIAKARASSEGLFKFLMDRLQGFKASSEAFDETFKGKFEQLKEGATRVAAEGLDPIFQASKQALGEVSKLFTTIDQAGNVSLNQGLVSGIREVAASTVSAAQTGREWAGVLWENREAVKAVAVAYGAIKLGNVVNDARMAVVSFVELSQAKRNAAAQATAVAAAESKASADIAQATAQRQAAAAAASQQRVVALQAEQRATLTSAQAEVALQAAQVATARTTVAAIEQSRAEVVARMNAARATMAQAEAQIAAASAAGAQSYALAALRQGTDQLAAAQARHAALVSELAVLGRQQTSVNAALTASTTAHAAATNAVRVASAELAATTAAGAAASNTAAVATDKLTAAKTRLSTAGALASAASTGLGAVVGALGGPIGIAVAAVATLAFKYWELERAANAAKKAQFGAERLQGALATGAPIEDRDLAAARSELERWKDIRDEMQREGKTALTETVWNGLIPSQVQLTTMEEANARIRFHQAQITMANARIASSATTSGEQVTLTLSGQEQAWRKVNDGVKTASAAQQEYQTKLTASQQAWNTYKTALEKDNASPEKIAAAQKEQEQVEKALADERDKKLKEIGAGGVSARNQSIEAQIEAVKAGYKREAEVTANGLAELDALRKQDLVGEYDAIERGAALRMADLNSKEAAIRTELALVAGKKDSAKEQAKLQGELQEIAQKRTNLEAETARQVREADEKHLDALDKRATAERNLATQAQDKLRNAKLDQLEIGKTGAALGELRAARVEDAAAELERQAVVADGIDLSKRTGDALRDQAKAMRENFNTAGYNDAARGVAEYVKSIDDANRAVMYEQSLAGLSQRDREIALEQYRIAISLKQQLDLIDANNPNDAQGAAKLKAQATEAAMRASAGAATKVNLAEARKTADQMDDIFRTGFANIVNNGKGAFKAMGQSVVTTFKTQVANEIYKMFLQPIVMKVSASVTATLASLLGGGSGGGSGTSLLGLASNANSLNTVYGAASQALTGGTAGASALSLGYANAVGMAGGDALGALISANGAWAGVSTAATGLSASAADAAIAMNLAAEAGTGVAMAAGTLEASTAGIAAAEAAGMIPGVAAAVEGGVAAGAATGVMGSLTSALSAIPVWGWIAAAVMVVGSALSKKPTPHSGGAVYSDPILTAAINPNDKDPIGFSSYVDKDTLTKVNSIATGTQRGLNSILATGTSKTPLAVMTGYADDESKDGAWGQLIIKKLDATVEDALVNWERSRTERWAPRVFADGEEGFKQYQNAVAADSIAALKAVSSELPAWVNRMVSAANTAGDNTAEVFAKLVTDIGEYPEKLLKTLGTSTEQLSAKLREDLVAGDAEAAGENFANSIVGGIENALLGNFSNQVTNAVTSGMVTPFIDAMLTGATTSEAISAMSTATTLERVKQQTAAFKEIWNNKEFQEALGELRTTLSSTVSTGAQGAGYQPQYLASTTSIKANTEAVKESTAANNDAADAAKRIADERKGLQDQIDDLTMSRTELIAKERLTVDASNRDLFDRLQLLQDERRISDERKGMEQTWLSAIGATAELRRRELESIDPANRALQQMIYNLEDVKTAAESAKAKVDSDYNVLVRSVDAEKKALADRLATVKEGLAAQSEAARESVSKITEIFNTLKNAIKSVVVESDELNRARRAAADAALRDALTQVKSGVRVDSIKGLEDALQTVAKPSDQLYGRFSDYAKAQDESADLIRQLTGHAGDQLSVADLTLKATEASAKALDKQYQQDIAALDATLKIWRENIDAVAGVDTSVISVRDAVNALSGSLYKSQTANQAVAAATGGALSGFSTRQVEAGVAFIKQKAATGDMRGVYEGALAAGLTVEQLLGLGAAAGWSTISAEDIRVFGERNGLRPLAGSAAPSIGAGAGAGAGDGALSGYTSEQVSGGVDYIKDRASVGDIGSIYQGAANVGMTAEQLAAAIVKAGYDVTPDQVRDWGQQAGLPPLAGKFATGGAFVGGGVVHRPTYFDMGQMGEAGSEGILPLANINGKLGVSAAGMGTGAIVAAIEALQALLATVAANTEAGAMHAYKGAKATQEIADRGVGVKPIAGQPLEFAS